MVDDERGEQALLEEIEADHAQVADDIVEIDPHTWAIHGYIGVDGDVLIAEFETAAAAERALHDLPTEDPS